VWASRDEEARALAETTGRVPRAATRATFHLRRYMPLYAFATVWVTIAALVPTVGGGGTTAAAGGRAGRAEAGAADTGSGVAADTGTAGPGGAAASATGGPAGGGPSAGRAGALAAGAGPIGAVQAGAGVTVGGVPCHPGVPQIPFSHYAAPCINKFSGNNGGATANGVTDKTITIAVRLYSDQTGPNQAAIEQANEQAGNPSNAQFEQIRDTFLKWFNSKFDLYGRKVQIVKFNGQGNSTDEATGKGQAAACADADALANTVHAFGVISYPGWFYESAPFSECAARYHLWVPLGGAYYPESWYQQQHPYVWGGIPDCEWVEHSIAEYIGKRLANKPAQWAGDPLLQRTNRKFGIYIPSNPGYQHCVGISNADLKNNYGVSRSSQYNYTLDVSQFPSQAAQAMIQFKAAGVTTVELACDPISAIFLTQAAAAQNYHPEWLLHGDALTDTDGFARLDTPDEVNGHLFGISQLGAQNAAGDPNGEAAQAWKEATGGQALPNGGWQTYYEMLEGFDQLQAAGPVLNAANLAAGTRALPVLGSDNSPQGVWNLTASHTAIKATQEVFWDSQAKSSDGKGGDFIATFGGRWFQLGELPPGTPDIHPR